MCRERLVGIGAAVVRDALLGGRALCDARALGPVARAALERGAAHGAAARAARHSATQHRHQRAFCSRQGAGRKRGRRRR